AKLLAPMTFDDAATAIRDRLWAYVRGTSVDLLTGDALLVDCHRIADGFRDFGGMQIDPSKDWLEAAIIKAKADRDRLENGLELSPTRLAALEAQHRDFEETSKGRAEALRAIEGNFAAYRLGKALGGMEGEELLEDVLRIAKAVGYSHI